MKCEKIYSKDMVLALKSYNLLDKRDFIKNYNMLQ